MRQALARLGAVAATAIVLTAGLSGPGQAASTGAPQCNGWPHGNYDDGSDVIEKGSNMKAGPYTACGNVKYLKPYTNVYFHCMVINDYGKVWIYVRVARTKWHGWVSWDNLQQWSSSTIKSCD
ncbi:hypothetical protein SAMN05444920_11452 [Nonomuraea solani]|uniref:SH3 domain-containing protein n=1 Tax=Nonomuraea solani TaxID=1144553 RepID=A0A1H6ERY7_9ACTN|nr:hypothetical protein [Nonomuraea solani]SEG99776.1 hypothetical protein SAMN05444920_11452 [Nonomuraea solani]